MIRKCVYCIQIVMSSPNRSRYWFWKILTQFDESIENLWMCRMLFEVFHSILEYFRWTHVPNWKCGSTKKDAEHYLGPDGVILAPRSPFSTHFVKDSILASFLKFPVPLPMDMAPRGRHLALRTGGWKVSPSEIIPLICLEPYCHVCVLFAVRAHSPNSFWAAGILAVFVSSQIQRSPTFVHRRGNRWHTQTPFKMQVKHQVASLNAVKHNGFGTCFLQDALEPPMAPSFGEFPCIKYTQLNGYIRIPGYPWASWSAYSDN